MSRHSNFFGFITVRSQSTRLPRKCFLEFGEGTVLDHIIKRTKFFGITPVVCTTNLPEDQAIEDIAKRHDAFCFKGSERDKLKRWRDACDFFSIKAFHTIDADDPFFDGDLAQKSMDLLLSRSLDVVYPSEETYLASMGYSIKADILKKACLLKIDDDTEMMWYFLEKVPGFNAAPLFVPDARIRNVRLTLDYEEDYWLLRTVLRILGPNVKRDQIEDLFIKNPELFLVNWFRNEEWKSRQLAKKI
ncbi:MAG: hypothetical protein O3B47_03515 [bacterium]|nr:hypothetical protein [bacterium]